ncbi:hypothetical protein Cni_G20537 [Canna indica]|uniref:HMA domain-containing protein n=1 Tax=Canna indica TaxID=4628 RepID=A0AAQ3QJK8_9LILI|nr:hypothetical protein Cni_G20537 [Canna indica]
MYVRTGVQSIAVDVDKGTVTIVGDVDAVLVVKALRKAKRPALIASVGENKKEEKDDKDACKKLIECCNACRPAPAIWYIEEPSGSCVIL